MKPAKPIDQIHSGTGEGPTPGDARRPASFDSAIRNPQPLPLEEDAAEQARPVETNAEDDSPNGTGYWQHDAEGPRTYVPPLVGTGQADSSSDDDDARRLSEALALELGTLPGWDAQSIHVRRREGALCLVGIVTSEEVKRAALRVVADLAAEPVTNDLVVR